MADKKYYWLKFQHDFFSSKRMKKLRSLAGGDTFTIIYLKMQLKSLETDGVLEYTGLEKTFAEEIALDIDESPDNVGVTINYLISCGLMEQIDDNHMALPYAMKNIGSEITSTERVRAFRERKRIAENNETNCNVSCNVSCNNSVTESKSIEIEKDIEKEKEYSLGGGWLQNGCQTVSEDKDNMCGSKELAPPETEFSFCTKDGIYYLDNELYNDFSETYKDISVDDELRKAKVWCRTNVSNRKTNKGMPKFLNRWLGKAQKEALERKKLQYGECKTERFRFDDEL